MQIFIIAVITSNFKWLLTGTDFKKKQVYNFPFLYLTVNTKDFITVIYLSLPWVAHVEGFFFCYELYIFSTVIIF